MASEKGTDFIKCNRPPRVQIRYQDPHDSTKTVELPFVMGVLSDLSAPEKPAVEEREFTDVTMDTIDDYIGSVAPGKSMTVGNRLDPASGDRMGASLHFASMDDFEPAAIAAQVPALRKLLEARKRLANLQRYISSKPKAREHVTRRLADPALMAALADRAPETDDDALRRPV